MHRLSVIILTHNSFAKIGKIAVQVHSLCASNAIAYEMIFVDDRSLDLTRSYVTQLTKYYPIKLIVNHKENGLTQAMKNAVKRSEYDTIAFIDADVAESIDSLPTLLKKVQKGADIIIAGTQTRRKLRGGYHSFLPKLFQKFNFDIESKFRVVTKRVFQTIELSDSKRAFDYEFFNKAKNAGFTIETQHVEFPENNFGNKIGTVSAAVDVLRCKLQRKTVKRLAPMSIVKSKEKPRKEKQPYNHRVTKATQVIYSIFALLCVGLFGWWWFQPGHIPNNFLGAWHGVDILLFALVSYIIWHPIIMDVLTWSISSHIKDIRQQKPVEGLSVAFITTIVPSSESLDLLHKCLPAMVKAHYKHDTWLLDEGHSPEVKAICDKYGVLYFSRKGVPVYNTKHGKFTKTKGGNHNSWYDMYGNAYDIVAQIDTDFVPKRTFLTKTLGYFRDPEVAFVGTPQVYGNTDESLVAKGAAEQLYTFYGSVLRGLSSMRMTLLIGANHIIRASALKGVDHYSAHITEDLITGMKLHTKGWKSVYISEALAVGEGPSTWEAYFSQQMRWAYGCMDIFFHHSPKMFKKMGFRRAIYYFLLQQHYFSGIAMAMSIVLLSLYFIAGLRAADIDLLRFFVFYSFIVVLCWWMSVWLQRFNVDRKRFGEFHLAGKIISIAAWPVWFLAFLCVLTGKRISYKVTPKGEGETKVRESFSAFYPHMVFGFIALSGIISSFFTNNQSIGMLFWALSSAILMFTIPFSQEITNGFVKLQQMTINSIRSIYNVYKGIESKLQPRRTFVHNTARQNSTYYSSKYKPAKTNNTTVVTHRNGIVMDSLFLAFVVIVSVVLYIQQIGFYSDDWSFLGNFSVSQDKSLWGLIQTAFTPNTLMRPMQNVYQATLFWFFGTQPLGYQIVNAAVMVGSTILFYLILRYLRISRIMAITIPLVYALLPNYSTDRFWYAAFQANLSMLFYFTSLFAALRAISYTTVWSSLWKVLSIVALVLCAMSYEVAVPFYLLTILILLNPSELFSRLIINRKKPLQKDIVFILTIGIALMYMMLYKMTTSTRLTDHLDLGYMINMLVSAFQVNYGTWVMTTPYIWGQFLSLYTTPLMLQVAAGLYFVIFWFLFYVLTRPNITYPSAKWMGGLTLISFVVFLLGYAIFFMNNQVGFSPTGIDNRVAVAATIGVSMTLLGAAGFISRVLLSERIAKIIFCLFVAIISTGSFLVVNGIATFWGKAYAEGQVILADIYKQYPKIPSNSTLILDGICPYVGPAPVFEAEWDLKGALHTHYKDKTLKADIVTPRLKVQKNYIETRIYTFPTQYPYKNLFIYNYDNKTTHYINNAEQARAYFAKHNPDFNNSCPVAAAGKGEAIF